METADVVIAGAGIIGLSLALDLASHGLRVIVCERGRAMQESSWAAAGMLAANDPENPHELTRLAHLSIREYPAWLTQIEHLSGKKVPFRTTATILANHADASIPAQVHFGRRPASSELQSLAPGLLSGNQKFLLIEEQSLDPRDLCTALPLAAQAAGVLLIENTPVLDVIASTPSSPIVVRAGNTSIKTTHFVDCGGAWAGFFGKSSSRQSTIVPRKGQILVVREPGPQLLRCVLRSPEIYLVPRTTAGDARDAKSGLIAIGATVEDVGYDKTVSPRTIAALHRAAAELYPPIASAQIVETWAGLRPASADELPLIGPVNVNPAGVPSFRSSVEREPHPNCWIATGHFRNGILLAPGTARALSQAIRGEAAEIDLSPFDPSRFCAESSVHSTAAAYG